MLAKMPLFSNGAGKKGLLFKGKLGEESKTIPEYNVDNITDTRLLSGTLESIDPSFIVLLALFRDYTFWASAYLLEPCDILYRKKEDYGLGRQVLPRNIAVPLASLARKIDAKPFMEYALSYALYNWKKIDPRRPVKFQNLQLIRSFSGMDSEAGFILVHVSMVAHSGALVDATFRVLSAVERKDRTAFNSALDDFKNTMIKINGEMEKMWVRSKHEDYQKFRTFIMGIKNQPMFPKGVIYEGVSEEPLSFRGESGANDSMIPTADNLFELYDQMPENPLTEILKDFRQYRPIGHQIFLNHVYARAKELKVRDFALADSVSALKYLENLDQIRDFRWRHWNFTKQYILHYSKHPVATGGSPIVTWLPNQLKVVLVAMLDTIKDIKPEKLSSKDKTKLKELTDRAATQKKVLLSEVAKLKKEYPDQDF